MADFVIRSDDPKSKQILYDHLRGLKGEYVVQVERRQDIRSINENNYYWKVIIGYIQDYTGQPKLSIHEYYKDEFLHLAIKDIERLSTARAEHDEFWTYIGYIKEHAERSFGIKFPDPDGVIL